MGSYGKEIKRISNCDEITTRCVECGKEIKLEFDYRCNEMDEKFCCGHRYAVEMGSIDFVIEKKEG